MRIRFDKLHEFIWVYYGTWDLKLFELGKQHELFNRVRCLIGVKSSIIYVISHNYTEIKVDSFDALKIKKNYFDNIFLQKGSYKLTNNKDNK